MKKYVCDLCGWVYDEAAGDAEHNIAPAPVFGEYPTDFVCPLCGASQGGLRRRSNPQLPQDFLPSLLKKGARRGAFLFGPVTGEKCHFLLYRVVFLRYNI